MSSRRGVLKAVLLGDSSVGKTSIMMKWVRGSFTSHYKPTVGADFETKELQIGPDTFLLQIWDTAGQERYQSLGSAFYRGADVAILVFDVTSFMSFTHLGKWLNEFFQAAHPDQPDTFPFIVLGNKCDVDLDARKVERGVAVDWCDARNIRYYDVSAKDNVNISEAMIEAANRAVQRRQALGLYAPIPRNQTPSSSAPSVVVGSADPRFQNPSFYETTTTKKTPCC